MFNQKGQSMLLYALMLPILFTFVGLATDFGWWYLNQSRLQNAADSAVLASATELLFDEKDLSDYSFYTFTNKIDENLLVNNIISSRDTFDGDKIAAQYASKNLSSDSSFSKNSDNTYTIKDDWNDFDINLSSKLYGVDSSDWNALYYVVTLKGKANHLFPIMDKFGDMNTKASAIVKITHVIESDNFTLEHGTSLFNQMKLKEQSEIYNDWDAIKFSRIQAEGLTDKEGKNKADERSVLTAGIYYNKNTHYRTELSILNGKGFNISKGKPTQNSIDQTKFDDLFIDTQADMNYSPNLADIDLYNGNGTNYNVDTWNFGYKLLPSSQHRNYRIHFPINFDIAYPVRDKKAPPDPLYIRIESEPIRKNKFMITDKNGVEIQAGGRHNMSTARQIIININVSNTGTNDRPLIFFYEGPEIPTQKESPSSYNSAGNYIGPRQSQPVILNLFEDFKGILFAPNSPVVINGNGHSFEGFVVAKEFLNLLSEDDFVKLPDSFNTNEVSIVNGVIDGNCDEAFVKKSDLINAFTSIDTDSDISNIINDPDNKDIIDSLSKYYKITEETVAYEKNKLTLNGYTGQNKISYETLEPYDSTKKSIVKVRVNTMFVDDIGNVQFSEPISASVSGSEKALANFGDPENIYDHSTNFNISHSNYNSFMQVKLVNYTYLNSNTSLDNMFLTERSKKID